MKGEKKKNSDSPKLTRRASSPTIPSKHSHTRISTVPKEVSSSADSLIKEKENDNNNNNQMSICKFNPNTFIDDKKNAGESKNLEAILKKDILIKIEEALKEKEGKLSCGRNLRGKKVFTFESKEILRWTVDLQKQVIKDTYEALGKLNENNLIIRDIKIKIADDIKFGEVTLNTLNNVLYNFISKALKEGIVYKSREELVAAIINDNGINNVVDTVIFNMTLSPAKLLKIKYLAYSKYITDNCTIQEEIEIIVGKFNEVLKKVLDSETIDMLARKIISEYRYAIFSNINKSKIGVYNLSENNQEIYNITNIFIPIIATYYIAVGFSKNGKLSAEDLKVPNEVLAALVKPDDTIESRMQFMKKLEESYSIIYDMFDQTRETEAKVNLFIDLIKDELTIMSLNMLEVLDEYLQSNIVTARYLENPHSKEDHIITDFKELIDRERRPEKYEINKDTKRKTVTFENQI